MAKKQQPSPSEPPSVPPERGLELLRRQRKKGEQLIADRPLGSGDFDAWQLTTREYLLQAFGSGSANVAHVMNAGKTGVSLLGTTAEQYEQDRAERLESQLWLLDSCIEQLATKVEGAGVQPSAPSLALDFESLHTMVVRRCKRQFDAGDYDGAIRNAFIAVEDEIRARTSGDPADYGIDLVAKAMNPNSPRLVFSEVKAEQDAAHLLYRGAIGYIKNPLSHRFLDTTDRDRTFEALAFASLLLRMLDEAKETRGT